MAVDSVNGLASSAQTYLSGRKEVSGSSNELTMTDFYKLLAAQMKYQDADNPMDTSEMMAQMVQTQMIQAITQMTQNNQNNQATSMIGQTVTVYEVDANGDRTTDMTTGEVSYVTMGSATQGTEPKIFINGKSYELSQIASVGKQPTVEDVTGDNEEGKE